METNAVDWISPVSGRSLRDEGDALRNDAGESFPVVNQVPRFVGDDSYAKNFGAQWKRFELTQMDSVSGIHETAERLRRCLGEEIWRKLPGLRVLECGCGAGRFTEVLLGRGANVTSIDLSSAVEVNARHFPVGPRHTVAQADILKLPFRAKNFDVVICLGVIQHTPDPERTMEALYAQVKSNGWLVVDHYTFTKSALSLRMVYRPLLKRLSHETSMRVLSALAPFFLPLHRAFRGPLPLSRAASIALNRVSPFITYYRAFPHLTDAQQREWALLDTHDSLTDWFKHFRNRSQIRDHLRSLGLQRIECAYGGNGVEARGQRPADVPHP